MRPHAAISALLVAAALVAAACGTSPLRVGTSGDYPPFSERAADGSWHGFDVEVARAYARDRNRAVVFVPFRWPDLEPALVRGDFDVAMSGVTVRADRLLSGRFTAAVARTRAVLVARPGAPRPRTVAVNRGGHLQRLAAERLPGVTLMPVDDNRALLARVLGGEADGAVTDALEAAAPLSSGQLVVVETLAHDRKAYWLAPASGALQADLDAWLLARERDGVLPALRARHLGTDAGPPLDASASWAVDLLGRRLLLMPGIGAAKRAAGLPLEDAAREENVIERAPQAVRALARAEITAAKAVQAAAPPEAAGAGPVVPLSTWRAAIDRVDETLATALAAAAPVQVPAEALAAQLRLDAAVPGADDGVLRPLVDALASVPAPPG